MLNQNIQKTEIRYVAEVQEITWEQLCDASPELVIIREDAERFLVGPHDRVFWERYESLKRRMKDCVGWYSHPGFAKFVRTPQAYDLAHRQIFGRYV